MVPVRTYTTSSTPTAPAIGPSSPWSRPSVKHTYSRRRPRLSQTRSGRGSGGKDRSAALGEGGAEEDRTSGPPTPVTVTLQRRLCIPLQTPLITAPPRLRKSRTPAPTPPRRSQQIAVVPREVNSTRQAQRVLMNKLGIASPLATINSDMVRKYKQAFAQPISDASHDTLQILLGHSFDPIALNLNMLGVEDVDC